MHTQHALRRILQSLYRVIPLSLAKVSSGVAKPLCGCACAQTCWPMAAKLIKHSAALFYLHLRHACLLVLPLQVAP